MDTEKVQMQMRMDDEDGGKWKMLTRVEPSTSSIKTRTDARVGYVGC